MPRGVAVEIKLGMQDSHWPLTQTKENCQPIPALCEPASVEGRRPGAVSRSSNEARQGLGPRNETGRGLAGRQLTGD